jgi:hypothetical protein
MPKRSKGYISVRNCVSTEPMTVGQAMDKFNEDFEICKHCKGEGHKVRSSSEYILEGITTIKYKGNEILEKLNDDGKLNSETVKKIIETVVHGRKQCDECNGFGFVRKSGKKHGRKET